MPRSRSIRVWTLLAVNTLSLGAAGTKGSPADRPTGERTKVSRPSTTNLSPEAASLDFLTKPKLFPIPLPQLAERLKPFAPFKEDGTADPPSDFRVFVGETPEIAHIEVTYQIDAKRDWSFSTASFFLLPKGRSLRTLREEVVRAFSARLGKPAWAEKKPPVGFGWRLHGHWELMVSEKESAIESIPKSGPHLEVTVCEPQGEPE